MNAASSRASELTNYPAVEVPIIKTIGITIGAAGLIVTFTGPIGWGIAAVGFAAGLVPAEWDRTIPLSSDIERIMTREEAEEILSDLESAVEDAESVYETEIAELSSRLEHWFVSFADYMNNPNLIPGQGY